MHIVLTAFIYIFFSSSHPPTDAKETPAESLNALINSQLTSSSLLDVATIVTLPDISFSLPRSKYGLLLCEDRLLMKGQFSYTLLYKNIKRLFMFDKSGGDGVIFIINLDPPIRQGRTAYPYLIAELPIKAEDAELEVKLNMSEETIKEKYEGKLTKEMTGPIHQLVPHLIQTLSGARVC